MLVCEVLGFSPSRIELQPSLDKTRHLDKKEQEIAQLFQDSVAIIAQIQGPRIGHDALERVPWSPRGPMLALLVLQPIGIMTQAPGKEAGGVKCKHMVKSEGEPGNVEVTDWDVGAAQITSSTS